MPEPILTLENAGLRQGGDWLFRGLDLTIDARDRLALIGRNGVGKTTLLKLIAGEITLDEGRRAVSPALRIVRLEQDPNLAGFATLGDYVRAGDDSPADHMIDSVASRLGADLDRDASTASGGERRRAALVRALAEQPGLLLLDEPTNHLDIAAIEWLENWLDRFNGGFVSISHDRSFLTRLTRNCLWLDRGALRRAEVGFGGFEEWSDRVAAEEAKNASKLDTKLRQEEHWLLRGVTARRSRNEGRLSKLIELRATRKAMITGDAVAKIATTADDGKTKVLIDAQHAAIAFDGRPILRDLSLRVRRGDRIGIIGHAFIVKSIAPRFPESPQYGFGWWLSDYKGKDIFYMRGHLGQYVIVIPEDDIIIVRLGNHMIRSSSGSPHSDDFFIYIDEAYKMLANRKHTKVTL